MTEEKDRKRAVDAEIALRHIKDQTRLIDQMAPVSTQLSKPLATRRKLNHFFEEYDDIYQGKSNDAASR